MSTIQILGTGSALPEQIRTNGDIEKLVDTSDAWIQERTGIKERRIADGAARESVASLAAKAATRALENAGKHPEEVDLILVATCSPEYLLPCCACQVQAEIGAKKAVAFDLNAACSGFLFGLQTAYCYLQSGIYKNALIIGSEVLSKLVDWEDRGTCILFGDGAGAVYVEAVEETGRIWSMVQGSNGAKGMVLSCKERDLTTPTPDLFIRMNGQEVYKFATRQVPLCIEEALQQANLTVENIDLFLLHQANVRILESIAHRLKVSMEKIPKNLDTRGNMSSAAIPVLLDECNRAGKLHRGDTIVLSGFGAGLTYGACVMTW